MKKDIIANLLDLLRKINEDTINNYHKNIDILTNTVNNKMEERVDINSLIGGHPFELMKMNHKNHANFMYNVFLTKDAKATYETYLWAYNSYSKKGFSYNYFYHELINWKNSFKELDSEMFSSIIKLYDYLISQHKHFQEYSSDLNYQVSSNTKNNTYEIFLSSLLNSDLELAISISNDFIKKDDDIKVFWQEVILPALYEIGSKWENAQVTVGEEHTATSICQRVMAEHYSKIIANVDTSRKILVTTSPNELHEVGSRMLADILELNGFDVHYLSSKTSSLEVSEIITLEEIEFVIISSTLYSNIAETKNMIQDIRKNCHNQKFKIIVGGQAYNKSKEAYKAVFADYYMTEIEELLSLLKVGI